MGGDFVIQYKEDCVSQKMIAYAKTHGIPVGSSFSSLNYILWVDEKRYEFMEQVGVNPEDKDFNKKFMNWLGENYGK